MLSALTMLDASNNEIEDIHEEALRLPRLEELELAFNRLSVLPPSLGDLTVLRRLTLQVKCAVPHRYAFPGRLAPEERC